MKLGATLLVLSLAGSALAQTPQPFPRPGGAPAQRVPAAPAPGAPAPVTQAPPPAQAAAQAPAAAPTAADPGAPTDASLGFPIYPAAQFIAAYDAGRGQRYYVFGAMAPFAEVVGFYRTRLDERGNLVFKDPPTHMFEVGRFREETMAFPPGVTVKDWTAGGSQGYPNPRAGAAPARFPTIVMIVPTPPPAAPAR